MKSNLLLNLATVSVILGGVSVARAQEGSWATAGPLATWRDTPGGAALLNGKALVVGGLAVSGQIASAELFDPATGTWSPAGQMAAPRNGLKAITLRDGRVLVMGGANTQGYVRTAELYDPATNVWTFAAPPLYPHYRHTATLLADGRVFVAGGSDFRGSGNMGVEIYDPTTNTWSATAPDPSPSPRGGATATLLADGKVLLVGGYPTNGREYTPPKLYDPKTDTWSSGGDGPVAKYYDEHAATLLANGKVLISGGLNDMLGTRQTLAYLYDPESNTWSQAGHLSEARSNHGAVRLPNGKVMVAGGNVDDHPIHGDATSTTEIYDPATNTWSNAAPMPSARFDAATIPLGDGRILMAGGSNFTWDFENTLVFTPAAADPSSHLAAHYSFSGNAEDRGPHGLDGVNHGATPTTDRNGNPNSAYYFNGNAYIDIAGGEALNGMESFTLSAWINTDIQDSGLILSKVKPNRDFVLSLSTVGGGSVNAQFAKGSTYTHCWATSPKVPAHAWTFLAAVWSGSSWQIYINGTLAAERVVTDGAKPLWTGTQFQIGSLLSSYGFQGSIDEVRIHSKALSQSEIAWLMGQ